MLVKTIIVKKEMNAHVKKKKRERRRATAEAHN